MTGHSAARYRAAYQERFPPSLLQERDAPPWPALEPVDPDAPVVVERRVQNLLDATAEWDNAPTRGRHPHLRVA
jgi:hypothetical protein